jgi:hypothetical protein
MAETIVTRDATGRIILRELQPARKRRPKRPPPTPAELGLADLTPQPPDEPEPVWTAEDQAWVERTERERSRAVAAYFSVANGDGDDGDQGEAFLFSDRGSTSSRERAVPAYSVTALAEQVELTEAELQTRLVGRAKLEMVDGKLLARKADVDRLIGSGQIPDPAKLAKAEEPSKRVPEPNPFATDADPAVEARTAELADQLGIDMGSASKPSEPDSKQSPSPSGGAQRVTAESRKPYRLGQPIRWGQS